jgi:hypothetical protein
MLFERRRANRDRRQVGRVAAVFAVRNTVGSELQMGQAEDVGPTGITLRRPRNLPVQPETPLSLTFDLPGVGRIDASGLVVSDRRYGPFRRTGVRFVNIAPEHVALLSEFCTRRS